MTLNKVGHPTGPVNTSAPEDHAARAREHEAGHRKASARLYVAVRDHIEALFGHVVAEALIPLVDDACEHAGEALYHYGAALGREEQRANRHEERSRKALLTLRQIGERLLTRQARIRRELPEEIAQIMCIIAAETGADYLWPPDYGYHEHDWDEGGAGSNCRNPLCRTKRSDEVPF